MTTPDTPPVHSLLHLADADALEWESPPPDWVPAALRRAPYVVRRRALPRSAAVPVGVRGGARWQRAAAWLSLGAVDECITPQMLVSQHAWRRRRYFAVTPAVAVLEQVAMILDGQGMAGRWGPGGSVGFELASGVVSTTPNSDLDIVLYAEGSMARDAAARLQAELSSLPVRIDALLETPNGAVSLAEYSTSVGAMLLRSALGPRLVPDPWSAQLGARRV
ncbi:MAG TPA: malonate decarboxylase holo-ACP synthase [Steroidobacteraceae bacterium]|nr:malonate decarboxylase holo-ACP synthase [Steroidobacteraceae bacterium]